MTRTFIAAAIAALAFAGAANAESVTVKLAGKSADAIHHDIRMAARRVCDEELVGVYDNYFLKSSCVAATVAKAEAQLGTVTTASAANLGRDASATTH